MMRTKNAMYVALGILGLLGSGLLSLALGAKPVPAPEVFRALFDPAWDAFTATVVRERIPRTVFSMVAGASLGVSGMLMQAITRNPIADPSVLGVNMGASLFVVVGIAVFGIASAGAYIAFALAGAVATAAFVYGVAAMGAGGATPIKLALAGAAVSAALSSLVSAVVLPRSQVMNAFRFWQVGSLSGAGWDKTLAAAPFLLVAVGAGVLLAPALNALQLGDDVAIGLGVRTGRTRMAGAALGVLLCGSVTALAGPIGFIGLMIPHAVRMVLGGDMRLTIPMTAVGGAALLTLADVLGRVLGRPGELEVGIVTAFLGAPILIWIAMRRRVRAI